MTEAQTAAFAVLWDGAPYVARVAFALTDAGAPLTLVSDLSHHTAALRLDPAASLLVGQRPPERGDPLTHPRITLQARARFVDKAAHRDQWLRKIPKAKLYVDFTDFHFVTFDVSVAHLNAGFGKAYRLGPDDLAPQDLTSRA